MLWLKHIGGGNFKSSWNTQNFEIARARYDVFVFACQRL